jgi:hypothetical protein
MKYRVVRDCIGYQNRYWYEGEVVEVPDGESVPRHFVPLSEYKAPEKGDKPDPMAPKPASFGVSKTPYGFAKEIGRSVAAPLLVNEGKKRGRK